MTVESERETVHGTSVARRPNEWVLLLDGYVGDVETPGFGGVGRRGHNRPGTHGGISCRPVKVYLLRSLSEVDPSLLDYGIGVSLGRSESRRGARRLFSRSETRLGPSRDGRVFLTREGFPQVVETAGVPTRCSVEQGGY